MRNNRGFTLVELMVVVTISILLLSWGIPAYSTWKKKHDVESQITKLYGDIQLARMTAYSQKAITGIWWGSGTSFLSYQIRQDGNNNNQIDNDGGDVQLGETISCSCGISPSVTQEAVSFDGRGFLNPASPITFHISSTAGAAIDCVAVSSTRIVIGKMNAGTCTPR